GQLDPSNFCDVHSARLGFRGAGTLLTNDGLARRRATILPLNRMRTTIRASRGADQRFRSLSSTRSSLFIDAAITRSAHELRSPDGCVQRTDWRTDRSAARSPADGGGDRGMGRQYSALSGKFL